MCVVLGSHAHALRWWLCVVFVCQSVGSRYHTVFSVCSLAQGVRLASETGGAVLTLALVMSGCLVDTVAR